MYLYYILHAALMVAFSMDQYTVMESVGYVEIGVTLSGRTSTSPVTVVVIPLSLSASGKLIYCFDISQLL